MFFLLCCRACLLQKFLFGIGLLRLLLFLSSCISLLMPGLEVLNPAGLDLVGRSFQRLRCCQLLRRLISLQLLLLFFLLLSARVLLGILHRPGLIILQCLEAPCPLLLLCILARWRSWRGLLLLHRLAVFRALSVLIARCCLLCIFLARRRPLHLHLLPLSRFA